MTLQEIETQAMGLLRMQFTGKNDPNVLVRARKLKELFQSVSNQGVAASFYVRLTMTNTNDTLAREFHAKLSDSTQEDVLSALKKNYTTQSKPYTPPPGTKTAAKPAARSQEFKLIDEDQGVVRTIARSDQEYQDRFINHNIKNVTSDPDPGTLQCYTMVIHFDDGRTLEMPLDDVPVRQSIPGYRLVRIKAYAEPVIDHFVRRKGTIIPMDAKGNMMLSDSTTPTLLDLRTAIEYNIIQRKLFLRSAMMAAGFAGPIAMGAAWMHFTQGVSSDGMFVRSQKPPKGSNPAGENGGEPPDATVKVRSQFKNVTTEQMMVWEKQGGHTLERHSWQLTREKLYERIIGEEPILKTKFNGKELTDEQKKIATVWEGNKANAASRWVDEATMNRAIAQVIHDNINEIRTNTAGGQPWKRESVSMGFKTGSGWVNTVAGQTRGVWWMDEMTAMKITILPRQGHIPSANDPEGWYVLTTFPVPARP